MIMAGAGRRAHASADYGKTFVIVAGLLELQSPPPTPTNRAGEETVTFTLSHFSAAVLFALFASRSSESRSANSTMEQVRYGLYCFRAIRRRRIRGGVGDVAAAA